MQLFFCNYHPNACLLISSLLPSSAEEGFCALACLGEWGRLSANSRAGSIWFLSGQEQKTPLAWVLGSIILLVQGSKAGSGTFSLDAKMLPLLAPCFLSVGKLTVWCSSKVQTL